MGLLPDTYDCGLCMRRERFPRHLGLAIPTCFTARVYRTCRDACHDRELVVSFDIGGGENVPGIPLACTTRNFTYLVGASWHLWLLVVTTWDLVLQMEDWTFHVPFQESPDIDLERWKRWTACRRIHNIYWNIKLEIFYDVYISV